MILSPLAFAKAKQEKQKRESLAKRDAYISHVLPNEPPCKHNLVPLTAPGDLAFANKWMNRGPEKKIYQCTGPCGIWIGLREDGTP